MDVKMGHRGFSVTCHLCQGGNEHPRGSTKQCLPCDIFLLISLGKYGRVGIFRANIKHSL